MLNFFKKIKKNRKGYTLTELIVVVAILGILAAIGTPLVMKQIQNSKKGADVATGDAIATAVQVCLADGTLKIDDSNRIVFGTATATITTIPLAIQANMAGGEYPTPQQNSANKWVLNNKTGKVTCEASTFVDTADTEILN